MAAEAKKAVHKFKSYDLKIVTVTVYIDRAEVKRNVTMKLEPGINEVVIEDIPRTANNDSIMVTGRGDAIIHEVQINDVPVLSDESSAPRLAELENELKKLEEGRKRIVDRKKIIEKRFDLLNSVVAKAGEALFHLKDGENGHQLAAENACENIAKLINYHEEEHTNILEKMRNVEEELRQLDEKIAKVREQIDHSGHNSRHIKNVCVTLESKNGGNVAVDLSYQVCCASWYPVYEIRVESAAKSLMLTYFGCIKQSSGEDWMDAPLVLSTAQPSFGGAPPRLGTLNAEFYKPPPAVFGTPRPAVGLFGSARSMKVAAQSINSFDADEAVAFAAPMSHAAVTVTESTMSSVFTIAHPVTIPSDSSDHKVVIAILNLQPKMFYEAVPSKSTNVFLTASVVNDSVMPLLSGQASVYVDNSFIAKNYINDVSPGERFKCLLGVDPAIKVEYKPVHKYSEQGGLITRSVSMMNEQKILIKNTKSMDILIIVREHVPKSSDEKIKIKLFLPELGIKDGNERGADAEPTVGARVDANHNLEWVKKIEANKEEELVVRWSIEYPNGQSVKFREAFSQANGHLRNHGRLGNCESPADLPKTFISCLRCQE